MSLAEIFIILLIHWVADFILQTDKQAKGKSENWNALLDHTCTYSLFWFFAGLIFSSYLNDNYANIAMFTSFTFICHTITDYFTSRLNSYLWKRGDSYKFFISVGFDQILHYVQLFLTYKYLFL